MRLKKVASCPLHRCYAIAPLHCQGRQHILVASEDNQECILFDTDGNKEDVVWKGPGGTMSMVQVPDTDGWFLATQKFYSPDEAEDTRIVLARPESGEWKVQVIRKLPFCHRLGIVRRSGVWYLIACTIKSGQKHKKEDWRFPGEIYVTKLPEHLEEYREDRQIKMTLLKSGLHKNHGFFKSPALGYDASLIGAEEGVFEIHPPSRMEGSWKIEQLLSLPTSDMAFVDFDRDGTDELITISPFHGSRVSVFKKDGGTYRKVWTCPIQMPMAHSIWNVSLGERNSAFIGHRRGKGNLVEFYFENGVYRTNILAEHVGSANIYPYVADGMTKLVSANREINEVAFYEIHP